MLYLIRPYPIGRQQGNLQGMFVSHSLDTQRTWPALLVQKNMMQLGIVAGISLGFFLLELDWKGPEKVALFSSPAWNP